MLFAEVITWWYNVVGTWVSGEFYPSMFFYNNTERAVMALVTRVYALAGTLSEVII